MVATMNKQDPFLEKAKNALDDSLESMDSETLRRLDQVRRDALLVSGKKQPRAAWVYWGSASGMVTAALVAFIWFGEPRPSLNSESEMIASQDIVETMDLLSNEEELALMEEIEFVAWLMEQEDDHAG